jgi:hypothetical protein
MEVTVYALASAASNRVWRPAGMPAGRQQSGVSGQAHQTGDHAGLRTPFRPPAVRFADCAPRTGPPGEGGIPRRAAGSYFFSFGTMASISLRRTGSLSQFSISIVLVFGLKVSLARGMALPWPLPVAGRRISASENW